MNAQIVPYMLLLLFATVFSFSLAAYAFIKRSIPAARFFGTLAIGIGIWSLFYLFEVVNLLLRLKMLFFMLKYIGIVLVPISLLAFIMEYTGISLQRVIKLLPFLVIEPLITLGLLVTNPLHGLFYTNPRLEIAHALIVMGYSPQIWFYVNTIYSLLIGLAAYGLMLRYYRVSAGYRRRQMRLLIIGGIVPLGAMIWILFVNTSLPALDFTSVVMVSALPFMALSVFQYRMLDVVPEARDLAIEFLDDGVIVINKRFIILDLNPAAQALFDVKAVEAIGRELSDLLPLTAEMREGISQPKRYQQDIVLRQLDQDLQFELRSFRLASWYGRPAGRLVLLHDVTATRQLEQRLRQAKDAAEDATRAKSLFLASMSHEIRTPLNAVIGMTSLLQDTPLDDEQQEFVNTIRAGSDTLLTTINDVLDFSKIEAERMELEIQPFVLATCIEDALEILAPQAAVKNLEMVYLPEGDLPVWINGDPTRLRQVLVNLLSNAVKFTDQGEVVVRARVESEAADHAVLQLCVCDSGIGIPPESLGKVFETFTQADASIARRYGGTGLGLTISSRLVHIMGGTIWVESQEGVGSTFHFTITVGKVQRQPDGDQEQSIEILAGKRVLVVDDNASSRSMLDGHIRSWGMEPVGVETAAQALEVLESSDPVDLILLDLTLPDMSGVELGQRIKQLSSIGGRPLVLLSSITQRFTEADSRIFTAAINKPIRSNQLYSLLVRILTVLKDHPDEEQGQQPAHALDGTFAQHHPLRILLAEDNPVNTRVAVRFLERLGYTADSVANGMEAVEAVLRQRYDLVLMDVRMPDLDGLEATRQIRASLPEELQPRIVAMTAYAYPSDLSDCLAAGMDDTLTKPIQFDHLAEILSKYAPPAQRTARLQPAPILSGIGEESGEIVSLLLINLQEKFSAFQSAWESGDSRLMRECAHQLKTDASYLGAVDLSQLMLEFERQAAEGELPPVTKVHQAAELLEQVNLEYQTRLQP